MTNNELLKELADSYGVDIYTLLENATFDGTAASICTNDGCGYTTDYEPDQDQGWCEICETNTVKSCLVLAGMI